MPQGDLHRKIPCGFFFVTGSVGKPGMGKRNTGRKSAGISFSDSGNRKPDGRISKPQIFLHAQKSVEQKSLRFLWGFISSMPETRAVKAEVICKIHKTARGKYTSCTKFRSLRRDFSFWHRNCHIQGRTKNSPGKGVNKKGGAQWSTTRNGNSNSECTPTLCI